MTTLAKVLIPLLLIVFVVAPGVTGFLVESEINDSEEQIAAMLHTDQFYLLNSRFRRGWFTSEQTAEFSLTDPALSALLHTLAGPQAVAAIPTVLIETLATHGVFPLTSPSKGGLRPAVAQTHSKVFLQYPAGPKIELPIDLYASLGVGGWAKMLVQPLTRQLGQGTAATSIEWEGAVFEGHGDFKATGTLKGDIGQLLINSPGASLRLSPSTFKGTFVRRNYSYYDTQFSLDVPAASIDMHSGSRMSVEDLQVSSALSTLGTRAAGTHHMQTGALSLAGLTLNTTDFAINFDLDAEAFSKFFVLAKNMEKRLDTPIENSAEMESAFIDMIRKGGTVNFEKLDMDLSGSMLHVDLRLDIPPGHEDILAALQNGSGNGTISLPQVAVDLLSRQSQQLGFIIQMGTGAGFIRKKGQTYTADIRFEDGLLLLNDLPMQLPF